MRKNLWGNLNLNELIISEIKTPKEILEEQAEYLIAISGGLVRGKVLRQAINPTRLKYYKILNIENDFSFSFKIISDYVSNYEYEICRLTYGIKMYPIAISLSEGIVEELEGIFSIEEGNIIVVKDEEQLFDVLQKILSSSEVHQVLRGLITIAKKEAEEQELPF